MRRTAIGVVLAGLAGQVAFAGAIDDANKALKLEDHGKYKDAVTLYTKALAEPGLGPGEKSTVYANMGNAQLEIGKTDEAMADFASAIDLDGQNTDAYNDRGVAYSRAGKYDLAIADYSSAIAANSFAESPLYNRAFAYFYTGQFTPASADFEKVVDNPEIRSVPGFGALMVIQLYLSEARDGKPDKAELGRNAVGLDTKTWPGPVVNYFLGTMSEDDLHKGVAASKAKERKANACDLSYYAAEARLLAGDTTGAKTLFEAATAKDCASPNGFIYKSAKGELGRL
jgi:lipoprotein NlpI